MKKPRYTDRQIAQALRQAEQGTAVAEVVTVRITAAPIAPILPENCFADATP